MAVTEEHDIMHLSARYMCILVHEQRGDISSFYTRDIIGYAKCDGIPMSIINIDQEKAFDRVSHEYSFRVLKAFGLGDRFISFIKLCYIGVSSFININGGVGGPVPLSRGIRQGDSISSRLYIMSIEPLLMHLRNEPLFQGITLPLDGTIK